MLCKKCGAEVNDSMKFCQQCGGHVSESVESPGVVAHSLLVTSQPNLSNSPSRKMSFSESVKYCLSNYVNFKGRASRSEYWFFVLFSWLIAACLTTISTNLYSITMLGLLLPQLAAATRRLHDGGRSAWHFLWIFVPFGAIALLVWFCSEGEAKTNQFG